MAAPPSTASSTVSLIALRRQSGTAGADTDGGPSTANSAGKHIKSSLKEERADKQVQSCGTHRSLNVELSLAIRLWPMDSASSSGVQLPHRRPAPSSTSPGFALAAAPSAEGATAGSTSLRAAAHDHHVHPRAPTCTHRADAR
eukprot:COSAG01_NODE_2126_length_8367_cov_3.977866_4_plen_143_part_00